MSALVKLEPLVDSTTTVFIDQLSRRFADQATSAGLCDMGVWLRWYAFDVIGEMTFSKRIGFLEQGKDVECTIARFEKRLKYSAIVSKRQRYNLLLL